MIVIYSEELGVYLGHCLGLGFWSKLDPVGQDKAPLFDDEVQAQAHIDSWDEKPTFDYRFVSVEQCTLDVNPLRSPGPYADIGACVRAGLPSWDPNAVLAPEPTVQ